MRVLVSEGGLNRGIDVGVIYILLYDPVLGEVVAEVSTGSNGTGYPFDFLNVPAGAYEILAGTDADNDYIICDAGEACGAWLTIDQPIRIQVDSDISDLDFPVEYLVSLPTTTTAGTALSGVSIGTQRAEGGQHWASTRRLPPKDD